MEANLVALAVQSVFAVPRYVDDLDDDIENAILAFAAAAPTRNDGIPRVEGYVERIVPSLSALEFKSHFRLFPETFEFVLAELGEKLQRHIQGCPMIAADKQLLMTLWRIGTPDSYRSIHSRFGVGKATAVRAVRRCTHALAFLARRFIQWPTGNRVQEIIEGFSRVVAFPGAIGAIDGAHIHIPAPKPNGDAYVSRKGYHSIQVQVNGHGNAFCAVD